MAELILSQPDPGENRQVSAKNVTAVTFDFATEDVTLDLEGADLIIEFDNGGQIVIQGVLEEDPARLPKLHIQDGTVLSMRDLLHNMQYDPIVGPYDDNGNSPSPEAGPYPPTLLSAEDGFDDLAGLIAGLPGTEPGDLYPELFPSAVDLDALTAQFALSATSHSPATSDQTPQQCAGACLAADDELQRLYVALQLNADKL